MAASELIPTLDRYKLNPNILSREIQTSLFNQKKNNPNLLDNVTVVEKLAALKSYTFTEYQNLQKQCPTLTRGTPQLQTCQAQIKMMADQYKYYDSLHNAILDNVRFGGGNKRKTMKGRRKQNKGRRKQNKSRRNRKSRR